MENKDECQGMAVKKGHEEEKEVTGEVRGFNSIVRRKDDTLNVAGKETEGGSEMEKTGEKKAEGNDMGLGLKGAEDSLNLGEDMGLGSERKEESFNLGEHMDHG